MKKIVLAMLLILFLTISMTLDAGFYPAGKIKRLEFGPTYGDIIHISLYGDQNNRPACATNTNGYSFSFDGSTKTGDKLFSVLLAAQRSGSVVSISGSGLCTINSNTEDVRWIQSL